MTRSLNVISIGFSNPDGIAQDEPPIGPPMDDHATPDDIRLISRAVQFAADRHSDQRRKGVRAEPYINHLAEVAALIAEATDGRDPALVAAAFLHDTVEDTDTTHDEIVDVFGPDIAGLVASVTDDKSLSKAERKRRQIEKAPRLSDRAKLLKIADKTSNLSSLLTSPPSGWSRQRIADYVRWAEAVVAGCRGVDSTLEETFDAASARFWRQKESES